MRSLPGVTPGGAALVFVGGAAGTLLRAGLLLVSGDEHPLRAILAINLVGACVLGLVLAVLTDGPETDRRRGLRLALGTGLCGGFTTYSTFAVQGAPTLTARPEAALGYGLLTLVGGAVATVVGIAVAGVLHRRRAGARR